MGGRNGAPSPEDVRPSNSVRDDLLRLAKTALRGGPLLTKLRGHSKARTRARAKASGTVQTRTGRLQTSTLCRANQSKHAVCSPLATTIGVHCKFSQADLPRQVQPPVPPPPQGWDSSERSYCRGRHPGPAQAVLTATDRNCLHLRPPANAPWAWRCSSRNLHPRVHAHIRTLSAS